MKNSIEMMNDIREETYKQIETNLNNEEFLITSLTIYDKNNSLAVNLFLTNGAIFMQESTEIEKIKKRLFNKIVDIKLTSTEFYIEFQNGYKIIGDTTDCQNEVNRFFECIKSNTTIKTSSTKELNNISYDIPEEDIPRNNPFGTFKKEKKEESIKQEEPTFVKTLLDEEPKEEKPKKKLWLFLGLGIGAFILILTIIIIIVIVNSDTKPKTDPQVLIVQNRVEELLSYQIDNNKLYDYLFELTGYYEEYEANFPTETKLDIESAFEKIKIDYESKFDKTYNSASQIYKIYQVGTIDSWMNENVKLIDELLKLYEEVIDEDYRDDKNIIALKSKLTTADTKIKKVQDCLTEEKTALNSILGVDSNNKTVNTETKLEEINKNENFKETEKDTKETNENLTEIKENNAAEEVEQEDEFSYENDSSTTKEKTPEGKQGEATYVSE